jgi:DNA-binding GntR family transcriptional regulator
MVSSASVSKVNWEPLHEVVYRELRSAIMSAKYSPGDTLTVRATAAALGVSPMPVRAAFSRLTAELAVNSQANGTVVIPTLTKSRFNELVELRILLEGTAAEKAAAVVTKKELKALKSLAERKTDAAQSGSAEQYLDFNQRFKFAIYRAARSPVLEDLIERLWIQIGPFMHYYTRDIRIQVETDEHWAVLAALQEENGVAAREAIVRDIRGGADFLMKIGDFDHDQPSRGTAVAPLPTV